MEIGSKKGIIVGVALLAVMALFAFWAFYFRNTDFYVSLFKSEADSIKCTITAQYKFVFPAISTCSTNISSCLVSQGPYNFNLPAGHYTVTLQSSDDHTGAGGSGSQNQKNEQYFVRLGDSTGTIANSSPIGDLPSNIDTKTEVVNPATNALTLARAATRLFAINTGNTSSANSIDPVCVGFDALAVATPTPTPTPTPPPAVITCNDALPIDRSDAARLLVQKLPLTIQTTGGPHFADVPASDPDYSYIETLYNKGITAGCSANPLQYCPTAPATRGQLVILVVKAKGWALLDPAVPSFSDVPKDSVYYKYIETAKARGLISGYADGTFKPDETILANQACALAGFVPPPTTTPTVTPTPTPTPTVTPTPTPTPTPPSGSPAISIVKSVDTSSLPSSGGFVAYGYSVSNTGNVTLNNISVTDDRCTSMTFVQGDSNGNGMLETSETWRYQCSTFLSITTTNTATAKGVYNGQTVTASDQETVYVQGTTPAPTPYPVLNINIEKLGQNLTRQETQLNNRVDASAGDLIQFTLRVTSDSNTRLTNVMVRDDLPAEMTYDPGSTYVNGYSSPDGIIGNGIGVGSLDPNQVIIITFRARVKPSDSFQTGTTVLINGGYVRADGVAIRESKIPIYVVKNILVPVGTVETGVDGATAVILASLVLTFGYHFARSGTTFIKSGFGSILHADSIVPSTKVLAVAATLLILLAGTLTVSTLLNNSSITQIEIRNPIVRTDQGTYFGQIGR